ncbi:hypothetical protein RRF57_013300 [Xylaria bambusicola]|uniref:Uncharacterized protein n=1 Tax=Xylaria bambusicola TaxID=326684 RepID=A0AAN7URI8_9PEZI
MGSTPRLTQDAVIIWFVGPLTVSLFQDFAASLSSEYFYTRTASPVAVAYEIIGAVSATVHISVAISAWLTERISWRRLYWPNHTAVQPGPLHMTEGAMLFMQY